MYLEELHWLGGMDAMEFMVHYPEERIRSTTGYGHGRRLLWGLVRE